MLQHLSIHQIGLISSCNITFHHGFSVITGETGAGKSMLIRSISLLFGHSAKKEDIHPNHDHGFIEGVFHFDRPTNTPLDEYIDEEGQCCIRRDFYTHQPNTVSIQGRGIPLKRCRDLMAPYLSMVGQHDQLLLLDPSHQRDMIDALNPEAITPLKDQLKDLVTERQRLEREKDSLLTTGTDQHQEFLKFQVDDLSQHYFQRGEEETLSNQRHEFRSLDHKKKAIDTILSQLKDIDLGAGHGMSQLSSFDETDTFTQRCTQDLTTIQVHASELMNECELMSQHYHGLSDLNINEIESRLDLIFKYKQKYRVNHIDELCDKLDAFNAELNGHDQREERLAAIEKQLTTIRSECQLISDQIHSLRQDAAVTLSNKCQPLLQSLGFKDPQFQVQFTPLDQCAAHGADAVEYQMSTNVGSKTLSLAAVASGGELSRILLALQTVMAECHPSQLFIFDEIDSGIGGMTAHPVAQCLKQIGQSHQVLCITHLAQVAKIADHHYQISKTSDDSSTQTSIYPLDETHRHSEIERMLGGVQMLSI